MKTCLDCKAEKSRDDFPRKGWAKSGAPVLRGICRPCYSIRRGQKPGALGRPKKLTPERIMDLLSISCEWWTPEGIAWRFECSPRAADKYLIELHRSGSLRRRKRLQTGAFEYQADPFWTSDGLMSHPSVTVLVDQEGEAA